MADASTLLFLAATGELIPLGPITLYEFTFPSDLSCSASFQRQYADSGSGFWIQTISFFLPHLSNDLLEWAFEHRDTEWMIISEDYNGEVRASGGIPDGLRLDFQASTGAGPTAANPMQFAFSGRQLRPFTPIASYDDDILFPAGEFDYGFDLDFS